MPHTQNRPHRTLAWPLAVVRGLCALAVLALLLVGVPWMLLALGTLPDALPSWDTVHQALMRPDDGSGLMTTLTIAAWITWLWLVIPVLLEIGAVVVRRTTPRLPGMATGQRLAGFLLGSILLASPAAAASAATPAAAVTAPHTPHTAAATPAGGNTGRQDASPTHSTAPAGRTTSSDQHHERATELAEHTVGQGGTTWWDLAEQYLGDGLRYPELQHLNPRLPTEKILPEGTTVLVPATASPTSAESTAAQAGVHTQLTADEHAQPSHDADTAPREYTAKSGDNLTYIAQKQLGNADEWPRLFEANKGEEQPYGHHFTNPDLIYPGQRLTLPADSTSPEQSTTPDQQRDPYAQHKNDHARGGSAAQGKKSAATPEKKQTTSPSEAASATPQTATPEPSATTTPSPSATASPTPDGRSAAPHSATTSASSTPSTPDSPTPAASSASPSAGTDHGRQVGVIGLMATGVLATGFLSFLAYRRLTQLRRRRRGHHIPLPQGDAARVEHALRVTEAVIDTAVLEPVLLTMAVHLADADRELPDIEAIVLGDRDITLHLSEPAAPVPPFTTAPDQLARWSCPTNTSELLPADETGDIDEPYPALVSLGWDNNGRLVLIDLEHVGHLHLTGPAAVPVLRTLALELATSEFTHHLDLTLADDTVAPHLAEELGERVTERPNLTEAAAALRAHHREQQRALALLGTATVRDARTGVDTAAAWTPAMVIASVPETGDTDGLEDLLQVIADEPRTATAVLTTGPLPPGTPVDNSWTLHAEEAGSVQLPLDGVEIDCTLQALSDEHYSYALETLAVSRAEDSPAPEPEPAAAHAPLVEVETDEDTDDSDSPAAAPSEPHATATSGPGRVPNLLAQFAVLDDEEDEDHDNNDTRADQQDDADRQTDRTPTPPQRTSDPGVALDKPDRDSLAPPNPVPAQQAPARTVSIRLPEDVFAAPAQPETVAAAPDSEPEPGEAETPNPVVRVLGPVDVVGARGTLTEKKRQRTYIELAVWLILHPGHHAATLDHRALDEALWPDRDEVSIKYRNGVVSRTRTWLGRDADGQPYIPLLKTANNRYSIAASVGCDWHDFQRLTQAGKDHNTANADLALRRALELVRGRPFSSTDRRRYKWAEHLALVMTMEIVDAAEILAERRLAAHDPRGALWAATKGLEVAPAVESLHRIAFQAYAAIGDYEALERAATWLEEFTENNELELDDETLAVLDQLRARI
ncbi:LysM peptidoglycan-binding domain-containing protein [Streptomyces alanosinicus]|uniref:Membrane protein n=1 Tax=Streptomyces alanosinicus TaxID=68171 RepID=A0A918YSI9_9ACTN|nr:LysM peptidoglycan-binding domain-containing protein [Streptomyces alanosinicus]GHE14771.1 membrane protein [Streptomyces alanosinicus]